MCIADMQAGDTVQILGPLGNAYPVPVGDFIAVSGGIGIASLFSLLQKYPNKAYLFYGARNSDELLMLDKVKALAKEICMTTDDGSGYKKGLITGPLKDHIESAVFKKKPLPIYTCGPTPMLKEIARILEGSGLSCSASLEEVMACGVGACLGCVVKTTSGYMRVCKEGPVFNIKDIVWE
jgi:dihydroorotate dehydrogenase electron transfer subunit